MAGNNLYGGTYQLFHHTLPKLGRTVRFVDSRKPEEFRKAMINRGVRFYGVRMVDERSTFERWGTRFD